MRTKLNSILTIMLLLTTIFCILTPFASTAKIGDGDGPTAVMLCNNTTYKCTLLVWNSLPVGTYSYNQLRAHGIVPEMIKSIIVNPGYQISITPIDNLFPVVLTTNTVLTNGYIGLGIPRLKGLSGDNVTVPLLTISLIANTIDEDTVCPTCHHLR